MRVGHAAHREPYPGCRMCPTPPEPWWRVTITHGALAKVNTARRRFRCEGHLAPSTHFIEPGQRYVRTSLPPDNPEINNDTWWHMRLCMDCCPVEFTTVISPAPTATPPQAPDVAPGAPNRGSAVRGDVSGAEGGSGGLEGVE